MGSRRACALLCAALLLLASAAQAQRPVAAQTVTTADELQQALAAGEEHIVVAKNLDLQQLPAMQIGGTQSITVRPMHPELHPLSGFALPSCKGKQV
jgi:hypothetical protein